jgi:nuclear pore complex protein Nup205
MFSSGNFLKRVLMLILVYCYQKFNSVYPQLSNFGSEVELNDVRETIQHLLRWGWKYNKNLEEQAAQLHMLTGWSQIVEVC